MQELCRLLLRAAAEWQGPTPSVRSGSRKSKIHSLEMLVRQRVPTAARRPRWELLPKSP